MLIYARGVPSRNWLYVLALGARLAGAQELPPNLVALTGAQIPRLLGVVPSAITALALHEGTRTPVHLQIDQRSRGSDGNWEYAFEGGDEPRPPRPSGLGPDDLLLLALPEAGERMTPAAEDDTEIEVTRADGTTGWLYLVRGSATPTPAIRYDPIADRVYGQHYALGFSRNGKAVIESLVLGDPVGGVNILDRSKARLDVDLALGIGSVHRTEDDVRVRTTGIHTGPLRIIRECEVRGRMLLGLYSAPLRDNFIFYADGFVVPTTIRLTPAVRMIVRNVTLRISMDLNESAGGMTFQSEPEMPERVAIDGRGGQHGGGGRPIAWYLLRRGDIGLLGWLQTREDVAHEVTLYYRDDRTRADPPETATGEFGDHGFLFHHDGPLPAGEARLATHAWVLHGDALDRPGTELRAFAAQPTVRVH